MKILRLVTLERVQYLNLERVQNVSIVSQALDFSFGDEYIRIPLGKYAEAGLDAFGKALRPLYESRAGTVHGILLDLDLTALESKAAAEECF